MGSWQSWLRLLIGLVLIIGLFDMLLPENDLKKLAKLVMGLVIMFAILQPINALLNFGWNGANILSVTRPVSNLNQDWAQAGNRIYNAGTKPVLQPIATLINHQLEALLITNAMIVDAKIETEISESGSISQVYAKLTLNGDKGHVESEAISQLALNTIARYLQISTTIISIEFA